MRKKGTDHHHHHVLRKKETNKKNRQEIYRLLLRKGKNSKYKYNKNNVNE